MNRSWNWKDAALLLIGLLPGIAAFIVYDRLPEQLATHFNINGQANGYMPKLSGVLVLTLISAFTPILIKLISKIDPKRENYDKFNRAFESVRIIITLFLSGVGLLSILYNLGYNTMNFSFVSAGLGVLFIVMGNYMGQIRTNYTFGIRTPWTLANEQVWRQTHRFAGPLWVVCGLLVVAGSFFSGKWVPVFQLSILAVMAIVPILYSYLLYRKIQKF